MVHALCLTTKIIFGTQKVSESEIQKTHSIQTILVLILSLIGDHIFMLRWGQGVINLPL